jgi:hypothetical protein
MQNRLVSKQGLLRRCEQGWVAKAAPTAADFKQAAKDCKETQKGEVMKTPAWQRSEGKNP